MSREMTLEEIGAERRATMRERETLRERYFHFDERRRRDLDGVLTIKEKLMMVAEEQVIETRIPYRFGTVVIKTRRLVSSEIKRILELDRAHTKAAKENDVTKLLEAEEEYAKVLDEIDCTPGLGAGYWTSEDCPIDPATKGALVLRVAVMSADIARRISFFRGDE